MATASLTLFSFLCLLVILISQTTRPPDFPYYRCLDGYGNYTENSSYQTNFNTLLSNLTSNTQIDYGFYNLSYGQNPDTIYAVGLCRGDVKPDDCHSCLYNSRVLLPQRCPYQKQAIGGYDECMLLYSNHPLFGVQPKFQSSMYMWSVNWAVDWHQYNQVLRGLLGNLSSRAASGDSHRKFAAGSEAGPSLQTIYALVQCTPNLNESECKNCLDGAISEIPKCCDGRSGGRVIRTSCNFRYESYLFYETTADAPISAPSPQVSPPPFTNTKSSEGKNKTSQTVIGILAPVVSFLVLLSFIWIYVRVRMPSKQFQSEAEAGNDIEPTESMQFNFDTIKVATNLFSDANKLGQGGFGPVYKGRLSNGQKIAVKRLCRDSGQGDIEFKNEVLLMTKLEHRNLVKLLGFCLEQKERLLVYELLPNKSLDYFIFDPFRRAYLGWEMRYRIIEGIA